MNYERIYYALILKRKFNKLHKCNKNKIYCECHHIIPKCMGGDNSKSNLVNLTAREHFIAHRLLQKWLNTPEMLCAIDLMSNVYVKNKRVKITSKTYQYIKEQISIQKRECGKINRKQGIFRWCHNIKTNENKIIKKTEPLPLGYAEGFIMSKDGINNGISKRLDHVKRYKFNNDYLTLQQFSKKYNISYTSVIHRLQSGWSLEKALTTPVLKKHIIEYEGICFSIPEFSAKFNISESLVYRRLCNNFTPDEIINTPSQHIKLQYTFNGLTKTLSQWAQELNIPRGTIYDRLQNGWPLEKALTMPLKKQKQFTIDGEAHTLTEWARIKNTNTNTFTDRVAKGMSIEQAISEKIQKAQEYTFNGKTQTITEWSDELGISTACIYRRLKRGWTFEKIVKTPSKRKLYTFNGETHLLADWAKILDIPVGRLYHRLKSGQSIEKAFQSKLI